MGLFSSSSRSSSSSTVVNETNDSRVGGDGGALVADDGAVIQVLDQNAIERSLLFGERAFDFAENTFDRVTSLQQESLANFAGQNALIAQQARISSDAVGERLPLIIGGLVVVAVAASYFAR